eukprot:GDKH01024750.1.p1 GENE.GDKH01024750.1~~GDKH01024750.1.p1  ORF type:complete len:513 (+),score=167.34 GDKH01024750.1:68-1606(+)
MYLLKGVSVALFAMSATAEQLTGETGRRVGSNMHSQAATASGGLLMQDVYALEKLRRFNHERIPERVVHGRGAGAHGIFTSSGDFSDLTAAEFLSREGEETEIFTRISTVVHGKHSPETLRDPRGFAIKFKTKNEGNWDLVGNNLPVFFIRDHIKFPDMVHSLKPDPVTNLQDPNRFFDFFAAMGGMATNMLTHLYSDAGIPANYRQLEGNSVHAYKMINARGDVSYVKFRWIPDQGVRNLTMAEAAAVQGRSFSHATEDLYAAIEGGNFPAWRLMVQRMRPSQLDNFDWDPLDATKFWPEEEFPLVELGRFVLNRVPANFHQFTEQAAFCPANFLPGAIEPSEDRLLQGRLISYHESQTHRLGSNNYVDLPVNRPLSPVRNYNQDGVMAHNHHWSGSVNYEPSMTNREAYKANETAKYAAHEVCGEYTQASIEKTLDFQQAGEKFRSYSEQDQANLIANLAADLGQVKNPDVLNTMCAHFYKADPAYGTAVAQAVECNPIRMRSIAERLEG